MRLGDVRPTRRRPGQSPSQTNCGAAQVAVRSGPVSGRLVTSTRWDVSDVLDHHGPGVYTVQVWATLEGEPAVISAVSVFYEVEVPEG